MSIDEKIEIVKNCINELKDNEFKKEFSELLYEANNPKYGGITIYYDFDECSLICEAMPNNIIVPNSVYLVALPQVIDFEEMTRKDFEASVENIIDEMNDTSNWIFHDEDGRKKII